MSNTEIHGLYNTKIQQLQFWYNFIFPRTKESSFKPTHFTGFTKGNNRYINPSTDVLLLFFRIKKSQLVNHGMTAENLNPYLFAGASGKTKEGANKLVREKLLS